MKHVWILIFAMVILSSFANADDLNSIGCTISLQQIIENRANCLREISGNNIYLKSECIFASDKGIYAQLNNAGDYAYIPELCSDADGCFIRMDLMPRSDYRANYDQAGNYKKTCPGCGTEYFVSCPNPDCRLKKKNK
jgi:hypothetical protein